MDSLASVDPPTHTRYTLGMLHFLLDYSSTLLALYTTNPSTGEWLWKVPLSSWLFALWNLYSFHGEFPLHTHRLPRKLPNFLTVTYHQTSAQQFVTVAEGHLMTIAIHPGNNSPQAEEEERSPWKLPSANFTFHAVDL